MKKNFEICAASSKGAELSIDSMVIRASVQDGHGIHKRAEAKYHGHRQDVSGLKIKTYTIISDDGMTYCVFLKIILMVHFCEKLA